MGQGDFLASCTDLDIINIEMSSAILRNKHIFRGYIFLNHKGIAQMHPEAQWEH